VLEALERIDEKAIIAYYIEKHSCDGKSYMLKFIGLLKEADLNLRRDLFGAA
jgi:hypothetical protein